MQKLSQLILKLFGWRLDINLPDTQRYVIIGYPHTSNWDFVLGMLAKWALNVPLNWVAKHSIFWGPFRPLFISMGGVPLDRKTTQGFIQKNIALFQARDKFILGLMPEGTRSKVDHLRTGFYYIAHGAQVPIALAYFDYPKKVVGIGKVLIPSGDIHSDFEIIKAFYQDKVGCRPELQGNLCIITSRESKDH